MGKSFEAVMAGLPARQRREIEVGAKELIAQETALREQRKAKGRTKAQIAGGPAKSQVMASGAETADGGSK